MQIKLESSRLTGFQGLATALLSFTMLLCSSTFASEAQRTYVLGVFPHLPPRDLEKVFAPMAADLAEAIGGKVELRTSGSYDKFAANLMNQEYDIAFVQPFDYVKVADKFKYRPLATRTENLSVIVVTKTDSPLNSVQDLRNKKVALPPKIAAVSMLFRDLAKSNGIHPDRDMNLLYTRSHLSCMQQVLIKEVVACGTAAPARRFFQGKFNIELKVIGESKKIPHTLWSIHPRVPKEIRDLIRERILNWGNTRSGQELLARGKLTPFVPTSDGDYNIVRKMAR